MGRETKRRENRGVSMQDRVLQRQVEGQDLDEERQRPDCGIRLVGLPHPRPLKGMLHRSCHDHVLHKYVEKLVSRALNSDIYVYLVLADWLTD